MPVDANAKIVISAFCNTPEFTHGLVRDLRVRWALEEIGQPYRVELFEGMKPRPDDYRKWQPFGQVPAFDDGKIRMFETGAILLYLGEQDERLLPREPQAKADATAWMIAALNSVEPYLMDLVSLDVFNAGKPWAKEARPRSVELVCLKLSHLEDALGDDQWLAGDFSIADVMMVTVLREIGHTKILDDYPKLAAYKARGESRAAFSQALADQAAGLGPPFKFEDQVRST